MQLHFQFPKSINLFTKKWWWRCSIRWKGLTILPTHRVVTNVTSFSFERFRTALADAFDWNSYPFGSAADRTETYKHFRSDLTGRGKGQRAIGVYAGRFVLSLSAQEGSGPEALLPEVSRRRDKLDVGIAAPVDTRARSGNYADAVKNRKHTTSAEMTRRRA